MVTVDEPFRQKGITIVSLQVYGTTQAIVVSAILTAPTQSPPPGEVRIAIFDKVSRQSVSSIAPVKDFGLGYFSVSSNWLRSDFSGDLESHVKQP